MKKYLPGLALLLVFVGLTITACNLPQGTPAFVETSTINGPGNFASSPSPSVPPPSATAPPASTTTPLPSAATLPASTSTPPLPAATLPPSTSTQPPPAATIDPTYPDSPNAVVQAFVTAYPDDTAGMLRCLSSALKASLPSGGPALLLKVEGDITGFAIVAGSQTPKPGEALVVVAMEAGNIPVQRSFTLAMEQGYWVITAIH